jgi:regulator of protease activity HflC (stomatin/prohibitin superfamily)
MGLFVLCCILAVIGIGGLVAAPLLSYPAGDDRQHLLRPSRAHTRLYSAIVLLLAAVCLFFASVATVSTKNLGVLTTFGRPSGYLSNGFHWKAPWADVTELNDAVQTDTYASDGGSTGKLQGGAVATCINVRIARQATACVNVSIRWQIKESGVDYLFRNYRGNATIQDNVVLRDLQQAMNEKFTAYDPLGIDANGNSTNEPLSAVGKASLSSDVQQQMAAEIGQYIDVQSVIIPLLNFDSATQDRINQLQQQVALTRIAQQAQQTAIAQAAANKALATSVSDDPNVLVSKCLDILQDAVSKGQALPAGFSCFGSGGATVAVPSK